VHSDRRALNASRRADRASIRRVEREPVHR